MAKTNVNDQHQPLPEKIERRLAELLSMGEFDQGDMAHCRRTYWAARADWHKILVDCHDAAIARQRAARAAPTTAPPAPPAVRPVPATRGHRPVAQGAPA